MRKVLYIAAGVLVVLSVIVVGAAGRVGGELDRQADSFATEHERNQREADAFYRNDVYRALSNPDANALREIWAPDRRNDADADALVARLKTGLAPFVECDSTTMTVDTTYRTDLGWFRDTRKTEVSATFATRCLFGRSLVKTSVAAQKTSDGWRLTKLELGEEKPLPGEAL